MSQHPTSVWTRYGQISITSASPFHTLARLITFQNSPTTSGAQNIGAEPSYRVVATDDADGHLISDTINTLFVDEERFPRHYVLGIINSNLMTYYFQMVLTNRAKLNVHMDHPYLGKLPIKETTSDSQNKVVGWVKKLLKEPDNESVREEVEADVFRIYGLDEDEQERVRSWPIFGLRNLYQYVIEIV